LRIFIFLFSFVCLINAAEDLKLDEWIKQSEDVNLQTLFDRLRYLEGRVDKLEKRVKVQDEIIDSLKNRKIEIAPKMEQKRDKLEITPQRFEPTTFVFKNEANVYDYPEGNIIQTLPKGYVVTSYIKYHEWIKLTGFVENHRWQPYSKDISFWVKSEDLTPKYR